MRKFTPTIVIAIGLLLSAATQAKELHLWGKQEAGNISHGPKLDGNSVNLRRPATIVRIGSDTGHYTLWRNGQPLVTLTKGVKLAGVLPPGNYSVRPSTGMVHIYLDPLSPPKPITLWAKQKRGPNHRIEQNIVVLDAPYVITDFHYDGTDGVGILAIKRGKVVPHAVLHFFSPHNRRARGPKVIDSRGRTLGKNMEGRTVPAGVYLTVPGIGIADRFVSTEMKLVRK